MVMSERRPFREWRPDHSRSCGCKVRTLLLPEQYYKPNGIPSKFRVTVRERFLKAG